jgi:putative tributyrin esterase
LLASLSACNSAPQAHPDRPNLASGVKLQDINFFSHSLGRAMPYRVYLPAHPPAGRRLPVVYLLHGGGGSFRDWSDNSAVAVFAQRGLILVMPEGDSSYFMNEAESTQDKYEDYLTRDLVADVESRFPAAGGRNSRAIIGVSMGGFAAIDYALTRPDLYIFAGAISPAVDVPSCRFSWRHADQSWRFRRIFGPVGSPERAARDPFLLVQNADPRTTPYIYLTAGSQEPMLEPIQRFALRLRQRQFAFEFHTQPGGHDWGEWDAQIPGCFASLSNFTSFKSH